MGNPRILVISSDECPKCGMTLSVKTRRSDGGPFVGCSGYPSCRFTQSISMSEVLEREFQRGYHKGRIDNSIRLGRPARTINSNADKAIRNLVFKYHPDRNEGKKLDPVEVTQSLLGVLEAMQ